MKGSCLCGEVAFELLGELPSIYQCHCSLCRKVSGSSSNSAIIVSGYNFEWISGQSQISSFSTSSGFRSEFCRCCGSPVPNLSFDGKSYWVPAGLLSEPVETEVSAHVYMDSRADWDTGFLNDNIAKFSAMPTKKEWSKLCSKRTHNAALSVIMISEIEHKIIEELGAREDLKYFVQIATDSENPYFLRELALSYNWDDGFNIPMAIANNKHCDLGVALTLFWLAEGMALNTGEVAPNEYNQDWTRFTQLLIDRLVNKYYQPGKIGFKPSINKITEHKYKKNNTPAVLYNEVAGA